jgi:uncharacterized repeat protein (TIGR03803 family)
MRFRTTAFIIAAILLAGPAFASTEAVLYTFCSLNNCADGETPYAGLIFDSTGKLFGAADGGGANGTSGIYELSTDGSSWQQTLLYSFCSQTNGTDGAFPNSLVTDKKGNLYGVAFSGGTYGYGTVFALTKSKSS